MKSAILLLAVSAAVFSSCSTAYKSGQTPDDVYYSPTRPQQEYVRVEERQDKNYYEGSEDYYADRYLRMRVNNRYRWSEFDDYYNNPYLYSPYASYGNWWSPWNSYWAWNNYCNPYYGGIVIIKNPGRFIAPPSRAAVFNPNSYINNTPPPTAGTKGMNSNYNGRYNTGNSGGNRYNNNNSRRSSSSYYNTNNGSGRSSSNNNSYTPSSSTPSRSYTPSSSSGSSGSSSSGSSSSGSSSRPPR